MHSGHVPIEAHGRIMCEAIRISINVHVRLIVYGKNWQEHLSKELTGTYRGFPRSPLR